MIELIFLMALYSAPVNQLEPGYYTRTLTVDGRERGYIVHVPKEQRGQEKWPVVLVFHGGGSNAEQMVRYCGMSEKAEESGFIAVYPKGTGLLKKVLTFNGGNCCGSAQRQGVNDVAFVAKLLDDLGTVIPLDEKRVYATGISNGAIMSYLLASELSDRIAAIAPVAGPMGTDACSPSRPVPVCHFHGTDDEFAAFNGGPGPKSRTKTDFYSVQHSIDAWVTANGCKDKPETAKLPAKVDDGTSVTRTRYAGGKDGTEVVLYTIKGGGHTWPGQETRLRFLGTATKNLSANDVMWEFFERHPRK